ncbi:MAG: ATP-binding cassette domain-containing protein, partial [Sphingopyxis sp.]
VRGVKKHIQGYLKEFLFDPGVVEASVGALSGGERSRLLLAREFARESNLLVLDEPTNDLDLETLDLLQEVIADYAGTVLLVSHDRDFLDRTVTVTLGLDGTGKVDIVAGGYADWEAKRVKPNAVKAKSASTGAGGAPPPPQTRKKLSYKDQRDYDLLPARIEAIEKEMAGIESDLSDGSLFTRDHKRFTTLTEKLETLRDEKAAAEDRWLELAEQVETLG